jgi:hypothetical protein
LATIRIGEHDEMNVLVGKWELGIDSISCSSHEQGGRWRLVMMMKERKEMREEKEEKVEWYNCYARTIVCNDKIMRKKI